MVLSSGSGPTFHSPYTHRLRPTQKGSDCSASRQEKMFDVKAGRDGSGEGLDQGSLSGLDVSVTANRHWTPETNDCFLKTPFPDFVAEKNYYHRFLN